MGFFDLTIRGIFRKFQEFTLGFWFSLVISSFFFFLSVSCPFFVLIISRQLLKINSVLSHSCSLHYILIFHMVGVSFWGFFLRRVGTGITVCSLQKNSWGSLQLPISLFFNLQKIFSLSKKFFALSINNKITKKSIHLKSISGLTTNLEKKFWLA